MTTNREKAAEIIEGYYPECPNCPVGIQEVGECSECARICKVIADALDAAGVLADDLPAPSRTMFPGGRVWHIEGPVGDVRATSTGQVVAFGTWQEQPFRIVSTPEKMHALARTLEAAANHAAGTLECRIEHQHIDNGLWHPLTQWSPEWPLNDGYSVAPDERVACRRVSRPW